MRTLNEAKFHLLELGVDRVIANSITQEELDICQGAARVKASCYKCETDFTMPEPWAKGLKRTEDGRVIAKCGGCYL